MALPASDLTKQPDQRTTMELGAVLPETAEVRDDHLFIGGVDMVELAREEGTALYVFDEADLRHRMEAYREAFRTRYENSDIIYASKAFLNKEVVRIADAEGLCLDVSGGAVVDVTDGTVLPSGGSLAVRHRYLVAEDTAANFTVTSKTAVVDWQGACTFHESISTDYNAMAEALKAMHLFQGSFTGYGQGFDLEVAPTRLQALIMFIRVLGEESEALAWNGTSPFRDVQPGTNGAKYVGYAFEKGYTNGYSATEFRPSSLVNARQYTEFVLRALGYSSAANTDLSDTLDRAQSAGLLTEGEAAMLQRDPFLRAELVYISYYALEVPVAGTGRTLAQQLMDKGVFTQFERDAAPPVLNWRF